MKETLKRSEILRHRRDVRRVLRVGRRVAGEQLYLRWQRRTDRGPDAECAPPRRVAFLLARGINGAVRRNRLKRRLRELYRRGKDRFPPGCDFLIHAAAGAADLEFETLARKLATLARGARDADARD